MTTLAQAIAQLEGVNPEYNNPGAISGTGDTGTSFGQGIGIYSSLEAGQAALTNQLSKIYDGSSAYYTPDMSLTDFGNTYAPYDPSYGSKIASILGVPASTPLNQIPSGVGTTTPASSSSWYQGILDSVNPMSQKNLGFSFGARSLEDYVVIIIGLLLILVGAFAFKTTQTVIQVAGKAAKAATEASA